MGVSCKILIFVSVSFFLSSVFASSFSDIQRLLDDKKKVNNKKLRPVLYQNTTTYVGVHFELMTIQEFDEVSGKFSVVGFLIMAWEDELLKWDPKQYGDLESFKAERGDFWQPTITLVTAFDKIDNVGNDWDILYYESDGIVSVGSGHVFESSCTVDITVYPWDHQHCSLVFVPWGYLAKEVTLVPIVEEIGTTFYGGNGKWNLVSTSTSSYVDAAGTSVVVFTMTLKRKPLFVLVNVILPIIFMSFLNMVVFLIPTESGERISYCLTVLLAIAVFLTLVGDNLPKTSDPMSILSYFLLTVLILSVFVVLATVASLRVYFYDEKTPVPGCLASLALCMGCECQSNRSYQRRRRSLSDSRIKDDMESGEGRKLRNGSESIVMSVTNGYSIYQGNRGNWKRYVTEDIDSNTHVSTRHTDSMGKRRSRSSSASLEETSVTWKDVSCALDIVFLIICIVILITATALFFSLVLTNKGIEGEGTEDDD